jgi:hypothetical protein
MKIEFTFDTEYGVFRDALHLPDDQTFSDADIEEMKQARLNNWIAVVTTPAVEITYTLISGNVYRGSDSHIYTLENDVYTLVPA